MINGVIIAVSSGLTVFWVRTLCNLDSSLRPVFLLGSIVLGSTIIAGLLR